MDDAGKKGRIGVLTGDALGNDAGQCGNVGGMFPQLACEGTVFRVFRHFPHLAHDDGCGKRAQRGKAKPRNGAFQVVDGSAAGVVGDRIGDAKHAGGEDRLGRN